MGVLPINNVMTSTYDILTNVDMIYKWIGTGSAIAVFGDPSDSNNLSHH